MLEIFIILLVIYVALRYGIIKTFLVTAGVIFFLPVLTTLLILFTEFSIRFWSLL